MSQHQAAIQWKRSPHSVDSHTYSRNHVAMLNGQQSVNVSASVEYQGDPTCTDPEQMLVSAVASCHMLTFLAIAQFQGYCVEQYEDHAVGYLEKGENTGPSVTRIELSPQVIFSGDNVPNAAALGRLHAGAHKNCFIANSIKAQVTVLASSVGNTHEH